jgi:adenine-specific DNA-methyltransferase
VRLEDIPDETVTMYRDAYPTMRGRADLDIGFFEATLRQLKENGVCSFICADRWMHNQYGAELRRVMTSAYSVEVIVEMHQADAFHDEVDAYPAITIIRRRAQGPAVVASGAAEAEKIPSHIWCEVLQAVAEDAPLALPHGLSAARVDLWFHGPGPWRRYSPEQLALLRRLEDRFPPLEKTARVGIGVASGSDRVFLTKDPHLVEPSRLVKLALAQRH